MLICLNKFKWINAELCPSKNSVARSCCIWSEWLSIAEMAEVSGSSPEEGGEKLQAFKNAKKKYNEAAIVIPHNKRKKKSVPSPGSGIAYLYWRFYCQFPRREPTASGCCVSPTCVISESKQQDFLDERYSMFPLPFTSSWALTQSASKILGNCGLEYAICVEQVEDNVEPHLLAWEMSRGTVPFRIVSLPPILALLSIT